jgi:hypothetical protein
VSAKFFATTVFTPAAGMLGLAKLSKLTGI